jgi:hypothetical protein
VTCSTLAVPMLLRCSQSYRLTSLHPVTAFSSRSPRFGRLCRPSRCPLARVAASSESDAPFEALSLRAALDAAVQREDFATAARLKKELESFQDANGATLEEQLATAVANEDYSVRLLLCNCHSRGKDLTYGAPSRQPPN